MSSALEEFRAQREAADAVHMRVLEVTQAIRDLRAEANAIVNDRTLGEFLRAERDWLRAAERSLAEVRRFREDELSRFWPGMWRRWFVALAFALAAAFAFGSGYAYASRPYQAELTSLRSRGELLDVIERRILTMTPAERREFDALIKWNDRGK